MIAAISNRFTMYRLMLYYLLCLLFVALILSLFSVLPYNWLEIITIVIYLTILCYTVNYLFATALHTKHNPESPIITALILSLIITPAPIASNFIFLTLIGFAAISSKYVIAAHKRHIFNPVAAGALITVLIIGQSFSWWIGSAIMVPFVILGGFIIAWKIQRFHLIGSFLATYLVLLMIISLWNGSDISQIFIQFKNLILFSPILFFSFVMLIEPLTEPRNKKLRIYYGILIGILLIIYQKLLPVPYTLELALLSGNLFIYLTSPNRWLDLKLTRQKKLAKNTIGFWFKPKQPMNFIAGQFLEWTLPHFRPDSRGIRRFFTIASSPTEKDILLVTKFAKKSSSFKIALDQLKPGGKITVSNPIGEFMLPKELNRSLVFIAGGIGITPFRSIIKNMLDNNLSRPITLFYLNQTRDDIIFKDIFDEAEKKIGLVTVYTLIEKEHIPPNWPGRVGSITPAVIKEDVSDYKTRLFYVSGPEPMVRTLEKMLTRMGIKKNDIKRDYFPGYTNF